MSVDRRTDAGEFYPGGKIISTRPVATGGDVKHSDFANVEPLPERFTDEDVRMRFNQLVSAAKGASAAIAALLVCATTYGAGVTVQTAPKGAIYNDAPVVTNVNFDATGLAAASNVYTKAETEDKIVELAPAPGNYAAVSNAAMNALQNTGEQTINSGRLDVWGTRPDLDPLLRAGNSADSYWVGLSREHICRRKYNGYYDYRLQDASGTLAFVSDIPTTMAWSAITGKPTIPSTAADIGALPIDGGTMTGNLVMGYNSLFQINGGGNAKFQFSWGSALDNLIISAYRETSGSYSIRFPTREGMLALTSDIPTSMVWDAITGKPTTISGYGITDALKSDFTSLTNNAAFTSAVAAVSPPTDLTHVEAEIETNRTAIATLSARAYIEVVSADEVYYVFTTNQE